MALTYRKQLFLQLNRYGKINLFPAFGTSLQNFLSLAYYSNEPKYSSPKLSNAMKFYLEKSQRYDKFLKQQVEEYTLGKKFLANMMGKKEEDMTEEVVKEAIEYLFPSALYVPKARPMMKPPEQIFEKHKEAAFDNTGRPFHFLFYTAKPNFAQTLHDASSAIDNLNTLARTTKSSETKNTLLLSGGRWLHKDELEKKLLEKLFDIEYEIFLEVFKRLAEHPLSVNAESFIKQYWVSLLNKVDLKIQEKESCPDGKQKVVVNGTKRKTALACVTMTSPGTGKIQINNLGLDYFEYIQDREQVSVGNSI